MNNAKHIEKLVRNELQQITRVGDVVSPSFIWQLLRLRVRRYKLGIATRYKIFQRLKDELDTTSGEGEV
jgi:hypothetical protein